MAEGAPDRTWLERYARHLVLPGVGLAGQHRLEAARVLVVGAGGLGSSALLYLAAAGVGTLGVADDDAVSLSNLQRQVLHGTADLGRPKVASAAERLAGLNPRVAVAPHPLRVVEANARALVRGYDLVLDGSDNLPTRYRVSDACVAEGKPYLYGALEQFEGQLSLLNAAPDQPCYRCLFPQPPPPGAVPDCAEAGVFGALPGVIGSLMALEALKHLLGLGQTLAGVLLHYDALASTTYRVRLRRDPACPACAAAGAAA